MGTDASKAGHGLRGPELAGEFCHVNSVFYLRFLIVAQTENVKHLDGAYLLTGLPLKRAFGCQGTVVLSDSLTQIG